MASRLITTYQIDYSNSEWLLNGGNFKVLQIPVVLRLVKNHDSKLTAIDGDELGYLVLVDTNGIGVYNTTVSPIADDSQFDTQVAYFDWIDVNQYVVDENGGEWWTGYSFYGDDQWSDILTSVANYYYAMTHSTGIIH